MQTLMRPLPRFLFACVLLVPAWFRAGEFFRRYIGAN